MNAVDLVSEQHLETSVYRCTKIRTYEFSHNIKKPEEVVERKVK